MSTDNLPPGWARVTFGEVVRNVNENSRDLAADSLHRVVGLDHLNPGSLRIDRWHNREDLPDGTTFTRKFKAGQVLFGKRRAYQRKVAVPEFEGVCSGDILVFEPADKRMLAEFLPYVVQSDGFFDHALGTSAGSLSPRTKWAELAKYDFILPPIEEQARIAALLGSVDRSLSSLAGAVTATEDLKRAQTSVVLARSCRSVPLGDLAHVQYGLTLNARRAGLPGSRPYLRVANVQRGFIDLAELKSVGCSDEEAKTYALADGDILVVEGHANIADVGRAAVWRLPATPTVLHQNHLLRVRATGEVHPEYLLAVMNSSLGRAYFASRAKSTSGLNTINSTVLRSFPVPMVELDEQGDLLRGLALADDLLGLLDTYASSTRQLRQSLMAEALGESRVH